MHNIEKIVQDNLVILQQFDLIYVEKETIILNALSQFQQQLSLLANFAQSTLNQALIITILLHQYMDLDAQLLEKMSKIVSARLLNHYQIHIFPIDQAALHSLTTSLIHQKFIIQQDNIFITQSNLEIFLDYLHNLSPLYYQEICQASRFNNNEINNLRKIDLKVSSFHQNSSENYPLTL